MPNSNRINGRRSDLAMLALAAGAFVLASPSAHAAWNLIDNFDSYDNTDTAVGTATGGVWTQNGAAAANVLDGTGADQFLRVAGGGWSGAESTLSIPVANNAITTLFLQFRPNSGGTFDTMIGLSPTAANIDATNAWQDYGVMPFYTGNLRADLVGGGTGTAPGTDTLDIWYNMWVVIDTNDGVEKYDIYTSTGTDAATLAIGNAVMRNGLGGGTFEAIGFSQNGTGTIDFDNIYLSSGLDLTNPVPEPSVALLGGLGLMGLLRRRR